jgi:tRNA(Ile)-lysidine synthase
MAVIARVLQTIERFRMFQAGQRVGVAVSGGADSVCLLHVLFELAPRWNLHLHVLHLDHQLRGEESCEDARFVEQLALELGLAFSKAQVDLARLARERGENLEEAARNERRRFFNEFLRSGALDRVALGHTRSDQAETVLFRFLRGSGSAGLAGIRPVTTEGFVRPLLGIERAEVEQFLRERKMAWRQDSSNSRLDFARNRIRLELLPMLQRDWNPAIGEMLAQTADWALEEESYWEAEVDRLAAQVLTVKPPIVLFRTVQLTDLPAAAARRLVRRAIQRVKGDLRAIDFAHVAAVLNLASQTEGDGRLQVPGVDVYRSFEWLRLAPPGLENLQNRNFRLSVSIPGRIPLPAGGTAILLELIENKAVTGLCNSRYNKAVHYLDWDRISGALEVRNWRPGDQYKPMDHSGEEKIKQLFQQARIPLWERRSWPVITSAEGIVWARQFGPEAGLAATEDSRVLLKVQEIPA